MILDKIENAAKYMGICSLIDEGLKFIIENDFARADTGKLILKDEQLYAMINEYQTKPESECKLEAHQKYIDIQLMVSGEEKIGFSTLKNQQPSIPYNAEKDILFYDDEVAFFKLTAGMFAIFFPDDLHQPGVQIDDASAVKKVVVKVLAR